MAQLNFKGKQFVQNYHFTVPFHTLETVAGKSILPKGTKPSLDDNLIIHGDNLAALKALLPKYAGRVKCIYIDPPYNTGNEKWKYNDNVNSPMMREWLDKVVDKDDLTRHDKWLCMMYPRLKLLRELLREDGVIFVSIDDNEVAHLRMLMDEIFGEKYVQMLTWRKADPGRFGKMKNTKTIRGDHEYVIAGFKSDPILSRIRDLPDFTTRPKQDEKGQWYWQGYIARGERGSNPNHANYYSVKSPSGSIFTAQFAVGKEEFNELNNNGDLVWSNNGIPYIKIYRDKPRYIVCSSILEGCGSTYSGNLECKGVILNAEFQNPKPSSLIKRLLELATNEKKDALILDSFSGSGTTAHAVLALNKEDGGNRKFILVEMEDYADKITAERVRRVIQGVKEARDENLQKGLGGSFSFVELGKAIDAGEMLSGKNLPSFLDMARYVFYTATGKNIDEKKVKEASGYIGETDEHETYLLYKPNLEYLKTTALDLERAKAIAKGKSKKRHLVFAPAKYLDQEALDEFRIDFAQLPFGVYRV